MGENCVTIERLTNGYTIRIKDPAIVKGNDKRDNSKGPYVPYKDPWREFVFTDLTKAVAFLKVNLPKAMVSSGSDDYDSSFTLASDT